MPGAAALDATADCRGLKGGVRRQIPWTYVAIMQYMKALLLAHTKELRDDGTIIEVVIWELPQPLPPSAHLYKYRLYYGTADEDRVRYDNERGKGDHRHVGGQETGYAFVSVEQLLDDFERDIENWSGS
jgi:hypothetical protein